MKKVEFGIRAFQTAYREVEEMEVPDDFFSWSSEKQEEYVRERYDVEDLSHDEFGVDSSLSEIEIWDEGS